MNPVTQILTMVFGKIPEDMPYKLDPFHGSIGHTGSGVDTRRTKGHKKHKRNLKRDARKLNRS